MASRIGKLPLSIPPSVEVKVKGSKVIMTSDKGELSCDVPSRISVKKDGAILTILPKDESTEAQSMHGLVRTMLSNQLIGLTEGFKKQLEIVGTGYNAQMSGDTLNLRLGFSHPVSVTQPKGVSLSVSENVISVEGIDKQQVGEVAANIRKFRPPEPYKGKGIKYLGEVIRRKAGKAGKA
ncbi:MAG: 50S ribosomal protein L6 [Bifidobacteriaceae bacterium]|nr:50S ribosomal protein L6 [Bifidobacteriaceae bacterium]